MGAGISALMAGDDPALYLGIVPKGMTPTGTLIDLLTRKGIDRTGFHTALTACAHRLQNGIALPFTVSEHRTQPDHAAKLRGDEQGVPSDRTQSGGLCRVLQGYDGVK